MKNRTIIQHLLGKKNNNNWIKIKSRSHAVNVSNGKLFIGRTPGRFIEIIGRREDEELSIQDELEVLGALSSATKVFPIAASPGSHWIYYALFSVCRKDPGIRPLMHYIDFLNNKLGRSNAGVARQLIYSESSRRRITRTIERFRSVHDIRQRISDEDARRQVISESVLRRLDRLVQSGREEKDNYRNIAIAFRRSWCLQSEVLRQSRNSVLVKEVHPIGLRDEDLLRVYSGYWIIRALYGIEIEKEYYDESDSSEKHKIIKSNAREIRKAARYANYYLRLLYRKNPDLRLKLNQIMVLLSSARKSGEAPLLHEYHSRQAEGRRILNGFRLSRFWNILKQLDLAVSGEWIG